MAPLEMGVDGDVAPVGTGLETAIEGVTRASGDRRRLRITADASVDIAGNSLDLLSIIAEKFVFFSARL